MKIIRVIVYEGDSTWIENQMDSTELSVGVPWNVGASVSAGGGGKITEIWRGSADDIMDVTDWKEVFGELPDL